MTAVALAHTVTYWIAIALFAGAIASTWISAFDSRTRPLLLAGFVVLSASAVMRWAVTGHPPIFGTYENSIAAAWSLVLFLLLLDREGSRMPLPEPLGRYLLLWIVPIFTIGLFFDQTPFPLTISERSIVVDVHVLFAWLAHTLLLAASTAAILVLARKTTGEQRTWDDLMFRGAGLGFATLTVMIAVGSVYSYLLFAEWFKWEIVETFAAAAWLAYSLVLHAAMMFRWRGRKLAWAVLLVLPLMLGLFWVWSFYSGTYHYFEIPAIRAE